MEYAEDLHNLPTLDREGSKLDGDTISSKKCYIGCEAHAIDTGEDFVINAYGNWVNSGNSGGGSGGTTTAAAEEEFIWYSDFDSFPTVGRTKRIYVDEKENKTYRYDVTTGGYIPIGDGSAEVDSITSAELEEMWGNN
jgi:hypothetical protein